MTSIKLIEKDLENVRINLILKDSNNNTKSVEISDQGEIAKHRHIWRIVVDHTVSAMDGEA